MEHQIFLNRRESKLKIIEDNAIMVCPTRNKRKQVKGELRSN